MKHWTQALLGLALAATVVACSGDKRANNANSTTPRDSGAAVGTTGANVDRDFIGDQLEDGEAEVTLAKIATERATNPQVKEFAQMMVTDHTSAGEELRRIATAANVNPPAELDHDHKNLQEDLMKLSGRDFDKKYIDAMVDEHQEAVNELEKKTDTSNPELRTWVNKTLPKVREHLEKAKQVKENLERANT